MYAMTFIIRGESLTIISVWRQPARVLRNVDYIILGSTLVGVSQGEKRAFELARANRLVTLQFRSVSLITKNAGTSHKTLYPAWCGFHTPALHWTSNSVISCCAHLHKKNKFVAAFAFYQLMFDTIASYLLRRLCIFSGTNCLHPLKLSNLLMGS